MSGGVDSSVTAYILKERGFEVEGLSFMLWEARDRGDFSACCSSEATAGASLTADILGIRHASVDVREAFIEKVIEPFVEAYTRGITPNPCILCNRHIKFPFLLSEAGKRGAEFIATGHYARIGRGAETGSPVTLPAEGIFLKKGVDQKKDQSYVLYVLNKDDLERIVLPLGDLKKPEVRQIARSLRLPAADRPESQEICFIGEGGYSRFIEDLSPSACNPGPIIDNSGKTVGTHKGIFCYTIGQRKGLGIYSPTPYYVTSIDTKRNTVFVGRQEEAMMKEVVVTDLNWLATPPATVFRASVKVRSMMADRPALVELTDDYARILFDEPLWAPAAGQSAVFYLGDAVLGGGIIK